MSAAASSVIAHKFGGTSMADADRIAHAAQLLLAETGFTTQITVVSALKGTTDALIRCARLAATQDSQWQGLLDDLLKRHRQAADGLLASNRSAADDFFDTEGERLREVLHALSLLKSLPDTAFEWVQGLGEVWSAYLLNAHLLSIGEQADYLDARKVLVIHDDNHLGIDVDWSASSENLNAWRSQYQAKRIIITGFIASDADGKARVLGRNGSDWSGAIFAKLFSADELTIWTDVDGVLSADPRLVPEAEWVPSLSFEEACELAYFGAQVLHPRSLQPVMAANIPLRIRNSFKPEHPGSVISKTPSTQPPVKGVSAITDLALVTIEGTGLMGVPGTAERVFAALHKADVSVVMISQASSEHSICCTVRLNDRAAAVKTLRDTFARELELGQIADIDAKEEVAVLAIVGDGMVGTHGIASRLFDSLARANVNVRAIAQGSSERNISVAVAASDIAKALRAVHAGFYLSALTISVGLVGPGNVGRVLLQQFEATRKRLLKQSNIELRLCAIANSSRMLLSDKGLQLDNVLEQLGDGAPVILDAIGEHLRSLHGPHCMLIDCSSNTEVASRYAGWLQQGIHVITPNKQAGSGDFSRYQAIREACQHSGARFRYEATVGAGLPIIQTTRDLLDTGDEVQAVDGVFSGTLSWLFGCYDGSLPFSALVMQARELGYTEPDPRDDLSGVDVARKLVILAREMGHDLSLEQVEIESLVPDFLQNLSREEFFSRINEMDTAMLQRFTAAEKENKVLRHVASLKANGEAKVSVMALDRSHAIASLKPTDNIVQFTTRRYQKNPLVVQGPGAGPEVTAAGVYADVLRVAAHLGAKL
ncbi:MAG: bifunctional aspartate kinase/homoserine dehydrogenase I [Arenimonas sp.]